MLCTDLHVHVSVCNIYFYIPPYNDALSITITVINNTQNIAYVKLRRAQPINLTH